MVLCGRCTSRARWRVRRAAASPPTIFGGRVQGRGMGLSMCISLGVMPGAGRFARRCVWGGRPRAPPSPVCATPRRGCQLARIRPRVAEGRNHPTPEVCVPVHMLFWGTCPAARLIFSVRRLSPKPEMESSAAPPLLHWAIWRTEWGVARHMVHVSGALVASARMGIYTPSRLRRARWRAVSR